MFILSELPASGRYPRQSAHGAYAESSCLSKHPDGLKLMRD